MEGKQVVPTEEMIVKIKAALDARNDPDFIIMARTDALAVYGIDEAIERANRYAEAGVDVIFIEAPPRTEDMRRINREVKAPTSANMVEGGKTPILTARQLQELGFAIATFPLSSVYAAAAAVRRVMTELFSHGTTAGCMDEMIVFEQFNNLVGLEQVRAREAGYYKDIIDKKAIG